MSARIRQTKAEGVEPLHFPECGLPDVYLLSGYCWEVDEEGDEVLAIEDVDGLMRAIGVDLALHQNALAGQEIRFLRKQLGITQEELARWMNSTSQLVARWERGETNIKGAADALLRLFYLDKVGYIAETLPGDQGHQVSRALELLRNNTCQPKRSKRLYVTDRDGSWKMKAA